MGGPSMWWLVVVVAGALVGCGKREATEGTLPSRVAPEKVSVQAEAEPPKQSASEAKPLERLAERPSADMPAGAERAVVFGAEMIAERLADLERELVGVAEQIYAAEVRARSERPELNRAYEAMMEARRAYDEQLARVEEYQRLNARRLKLQEEHRALAARLDRIGQERKTP